MQTASPIRAYPSPEAHQARQVGWVVILVVLLHALILLAFIFRPEDQSPAPREIIEITLEASPTNSPHTLEKRSELPKPQLTETPAVTPVPPSPQTAQMSPEAPPQVSPPSPPPETTTQINSPQPEEIQPLFRLTRQPKPLGKIEPAYPASERRAGIQANVVAEVTIDARGEVQDVRILKSAGSAFDTAVIEALRKSTFSPGYIGDKAVPVRFQVPFRFNLN